MTLLLLLAACAHVAPAPSPTAADVVEDALLQAADFGCLQGFAQVGRSRYGNANGHLEATLAVARGPAGGVYPVGTVVQLVPAEAMVKRHAGFSPATGDWEFFKLTVRDGGTVIVDRGTTEVRNIAGTCVGCHAPAKDHDYVCASDRGCKPLPGFVVAAADGKVAKDARCDR